MTFMLWSGGSGVVRCTATFACEKFHKRVNSPREMADEKFSAKGQGTGPAAGGPGGPSPASFAGAGAQFVVSILLFLYVGKWLDAKLGTAPWLLMLGVFVGAGAGFYSFYRRIMAASRDHGDG
jgi:putative F0F1-ATPase subunit (Ca2+/Mg2+ transporter)